MADRCLEVVSAKVWLGAMVAATVLVIAVGSRSVRATAPVVRQLPPEAPWLTPDAAAQVVRPDGRLGPLFEGVELGGLAPSPAVRARIAAFARTHNVKIDLDIVDDEVAAVRFEVMFGGCCGYEGADTFALRIGQPRMYTCCGCGERSWYDDWALSTGDGVHLRARVRVNRVLLHWRRELTRAELLERADRLLGADRAVVAKTARTDWVEVERGTQYLLEVPYPFTRYELESRDGRGIQLVAEHLRIVQVAVSIPDDAVDGAGETTTLLRARWGRPRIVDDTWTWRLPDRIITAELGAGMTRVTARVR